MILKHERVHRRGRQEGKIQSVNELRELGHGHLKLKEGPQVEECR